MGGFFNHTNWQGIATAHFSSYKSNQHNEVKLPQENADFTCESCPYSIKNHNGTQWYMKLAKTFITWGQNNFFQCAPTNFHRYNVLRQVHFTLQPLGEKVRLRTEAQSCQKVETSQSPSAEQWLVGCPLSCAAQHLVLGCKKIQLLCCFSAWKNHPRTCVIRWTCL